MRNQKILKYLIVLCVFLLAFGIVIAFAYENRTVHSKVAYQSVESGINSSETIAEEQVPLAAPQGIEAAELGADVVIAEEELPVVYIDNRETTSVTPTPTPSLPAEQPATPSPIPEEPAAGPETPAAEEPTPTPEEPTPTPYEPTPSPAPAKAQKPADITDTVSMAKYLFDAATEFWAVEKDFCGTTTRPVSTRVAASIGAGTAVDCPGGDTVRIDKNGVAHDSYAIADHFRAYVDMPDLQYFKIYLSEKDFSVNPYGAREEVIGSYYQYGSDRTTYLPEEEEDVD